MKRHIERQIDDKKSRKMNGQTDGQINWDISMKSGQFIERMDARVR